MKLSEVLRLLQEKDGVTFTRQYLDKLVNKGVIPFDEVNGKKVFEYKTVAEAIRTSQQRPKGIEEKFDPKDKDGKDKTINSTKIKLQDYQGKLAQQKFDVEAGKLVYREDVENKAFTVARVIRDQFLTLPERVSGGLLGLDNVHDIREYLHKEINLVLEGLTAKGLYES